MNIISVSENSERRQKPIGSHDYFEMTLKQIASFIVNHHNRIQFFGYEFANIAFIASAFLVGAGFSNQTYLEIWAVAAFMLGSFLIIFFHGARRPTMLFYGGVALTFGGLLLVVSGYPITGLSVVLASLETVRGGIFAMIEHCDSRRTKPLEITRFTDKSLRLARGTFGWYLCWIKKLTDQFKSFGKFIDSRPFLTGAIIKAPLRLEFIAKKTLTGDLIGAGVGLSWMVLGDGALALNDNKLKARLIAYVNS